MALRFCKGKYDIIELNNKKEIYSIKKKYKGKLKDKFLIIKIKNKFVYYIDFKENINYVFLTKDDCFDNAHDIFINLNLEYIPVIDKEKIICFCYNDEYLDDVLYKIKDLIAFGNVKILNTLYDNAIIYGYNELSYYLEKLLKKNNLNYKIVDNLFEKNNDIFENCKTMKIYVEGNKGDSISNYAYWKVFHEWLFESVKPIYDLYNQNNKCIYSDEDIVCNYIKQSKPFMMARVGNTELWIVKQYLEKRLNLVNEYSDFWLKYLFETSGFFAKDNNIKDVDKFAIEHIEAIKNCDFNLCYGNDELAEGLNMVLKYFQNNNGLNFDWDKLTNPFDNKWFYCLMNKKILVISPYSESIKQQIKNIDNLFESKYPNMSIITYQCLETQLNNNLGYNSFFNALEKMKVDINKIDFDIAFICAGAYGYLLADYIKKIGKSSIELCSYVPNWFGIKIKRYCTNINVNKYWNNNWIFPIEKPIKDSEKIEDGCYWE